MLKLILLSLALSACVPGASASDSSMDADDAAVALDSEASLEVSSDALPPHVDGGASMDAE